MVPVLCCYVVWLRVGWIVGSLIRFSPQFLDFKDSESLSVSRDRILRFSVVVIGYFIEWEQIWILYFIDKFVLFQFMIYIQKIMRLYL